MEKLEGFDQLTGEEVLNRIAQAFNVDPERVSKTLGQKISINLNTFWHLRIEEKCAVVATRSKVVKLVLAAPVKDVLNNADINTMCVSGVIPRKKYKLGDQIETMGAGFAPGTNAAGHYLPPCSPQYSK